MLGRCSGHISDMVSDMDTDTVLDLTALADKWLQIGLDKKINFNK